MKKKIALVTGSSGQDGSYLCELLLKKNYRVIAGDRRSSRDNKWRHRFLGIENKLIYEYFDLTDFNSILRVFKKYNINEVYNLAAQSFVKESFNSPISSTDSTATGVLRILEIIREKNKKIKFYQASSSEMFGKTKSKFQNENTPFYPQSPYAVAKLFAHEITKNYRSSYNMFACSGILFNHESPIRGSEFVTQKIVTQLVEIKNKERKILELGNIYAKRDWGFAKDYVEAMWLMLQQNKPEDFVIATNKTISVKQFINICCKILGINLKWKGKNLNEIGINKNDGKTIIKINPIFYRPSEVEYLKGSYKKAQKLLKWKPKTNIYALARIMIESAKNAHKK